MKILKKVFAALFAGSLLAAVVGLGILSGENPKWIAWFGIASAIIAPVGLSLFSYAFASSNSEVIQQLAKVPEIAHLMKEAKTQEEKIQILEKERLQLVEIIKQESRRQAAQDRIESLERDAVRIIHELEGLSQELTQLDTQIGHSSVSQEVQRLRERISAREKGDVFINMGNHSYRIDRDIVNALPFGFGSLVLVYFRIFERIQKQLTDAPRKSKLG